MERDRAERAGAVFTQALAEVAVRVWDRPARLRAAVAEYTAATGERARIVSVASTATAGAASLVASTFPADAAVGRAAPRRLGPEEKASFDRAQRLRANRATNAEERSAQRPVLDLRALPDGGLSVAAPIPGPQGEVVAAVEVETAPPPPAPGGSAPLALLWSLAAVAAVAVLAPRLERRRWTLIAAAGALVLGALAAFHVHARRAVADDLARAQRAAVRDVDDAGRLARALLGAEGAADPALDPAGWSTDRFGARRALAGPVAAAQLERGLGLGGDDARRSALAVAGLALAVLLAIALGGVSRLRATLVEHRQAYLYILPAVAGTLLLVFFPFFYGIAISFTDQNIYNSGRSLSELWVGLRNYVDILSDFGMVRRSASGGYAINYLNFYWTFIFTVLWTITNVAWGVGVGMLVALTLNQRIAARPIYRILLIFPWATPNYITALVWKGMFHQQFGVVNQVVQLLGGDPISWYDHPFTSFLTAWACNGWLSIPFNVVVTLGALQSIPADMYEAARVEGASRWQQFKAITLPSLRPALVPEIILGVVWTFNMFNVIFLVTGGEPDSSTEILVTQSYKYAFERYRYGYAAAYSTVIFLILLAYGVFQNRVSRGTEAVAE